jgi:hypothetical protein
MKWETIKIPAFIIGVVLVLILSLKIKTWIKDQGDYGFKERRIEDKALDKEIETKKQLLDSLDNAMFELNKQQWVSDDKLNTLNEQSQIRYNEFIQDFAIIDSPSSIDDKIDLLWTRLSRQDSLRERYFDRHNRRNPR